MKQAPDFKTHTEHDVWVRDNADYFTVIIHAYRARARFEVDTIEKARALAKALLEEGHRSPAMIYAVCDPYSAYVESVRCQKSDSAPN